MASSRPYARAYLEAILNPPPSSGTIGSRPVSMQRTPSRKEIGAASPATIATEQYKPARSSILAAQQSDREEVESPDHEEGESEVEGQGTKDENDAPGTPLYSKARPVGIDDYPTTPSRSASSSLFSPDDDEVDGSRFLRISTMNQIRRRPSETALSHNSVRHVLGLLDDEDAEEEERIENVRLALAKRLREIEGNEVPSARLDSIVLQLLHRHREDVHPTGATFPQPASPGPSPFPPSPRARPRPANLRSGSSANQAWAWTPTRPSTPSSASFGPLGDVSSPLSSSPMMAPASLTGAPASSNTASPRASPSLFHRALASHASSSSASAGMEFKGTSSDTGASRPSSPTPGQMGSPSLNVGALEFKPRSSTSVTGSAATTPREPWLPEPSDSKTPSSYRGPLDDSDDDEFSPFASTSTLAMPVPTAPAAFSLSRPPAGRGRPISHTSGNSSIQSLQNGPDSIGGSYHGSTTSASLDSNDDAPRNAQMLGLESDFDGLTMSPFDVLTSILAGIGSTNPNAPTWSPEQIEEALERCSWDIDAAVSMLLDHGPGQSGFAPPTGPRSPMPGHRQPTSAAAGSSRFGVSIVPRDVFASQRAGMVRNPSQQDVRPGFARVPSSGPPSSPHMANVGAPGRQVPGRVCRFYLAGECRRADCRFSHDVSRAVCRFWLKGQCLNGDECSFVHDSSLLDSVANRVSSLSSQSPSATPLDVETPANEDFPELNLAPTGPKAHRERQAAVAAAASSNDPARTRWAQTVQRKWNSPMAQLQQGESHIALNPKAAPVRGAPTGPRAGVSGGASPASLRGGPSSRIALRPPLLLPTLVTGRAASNAYTSYREACVALSDKRNKCLARAAEAWKSGNGAEARKWSREGQSVNHLLQEESRTMARNMLRERHEDLRARLGSSGSGSGSGGNGLVDASTDEKGARGLRGKVMGAGLGICLGVVPARTRVPGVTGDAGLAAQSLDERTDAFLDCHLLHASEAIELVEEFLIGLEREQFRGLAYLAVGLGKHTSADTDKRRVGLASGVRSFLSNWGYPFAEHDGTIVVDPLSHF